MHRVFYEPSLNFIVSMVDGAGEVTAHRLSDNAYRVKRVVGVGVDTGFNPHPPFSDGDVIIVGNGKRANVRCVHGDITYQMQEISSLQAQRLILTENGLGAIGTKEFRLNEQYDNSEELRFIAEMEKVLLNMNTLMENVEKLKYKN